MSLLIPAAVTKPKAALAGHIGVGHAYSHSGFVQEDSVGFAALLEVLCRAYPMDFTVTRVDGEENVVRIHTAQGGVGEAVSQRGFTPFERRMMQQAVGSKSLAPQTVAIEIFGRMYGQGVSEPASAFSQALAKAYVNTVQKGWPQQTLYALEDVPLCCGEFLGGGLSVNGQPVAWLLSVNATLGGIGPIEDAEGIIPIGNKGELMASLGMDLCPTLILESKAYVPDISNDIGETTYYARWNAEYDNAVVGQCLYQALRESALPFKVEDNAYSRNGALRDETQRIGEAIAQLGNEYARSSSAPQKVAIAYTLARMVSQDMGGSIFMSEDIFAYAGAGGLWPGQAAVLSCLTTHEALLSRGTMTVTEDELRHLANIALMTVEYMAQRHGEAQEILLRKRPLHTPQQLLHMVETAKH